jgi:hypothetical protein
LLPDEELFQKARLVVSAEVAKIHTLEWSPAILGFNPPLSAGMDINWHGLSENLPIPSSIYNDLSKVRGILAPFQGHCIRLWFQKGLKTFLSKYHGRET